MHPRVPKNTPDGCDPQPPATNPDVSPAGRLHSMKLVVVGIAAVMLLGASSACTRAAGGDGGSGGEAQNAQQEDASDNGQDNQSNDDRDDGREEIGALTETPTAATTQEMKTGTTEIIRTIEATMIGMTCATIETTAGATIETMTVTLTRRVGKTFAVIGMMTGTMAMIRTIETTRTMTVVMMTTEREG